MLIAFTINSPTPTPLPPLSAISSFSVDFGLSWTVPIARGDMTSWSYKTHKKGNAGKIAMLRFSNLWLQKMEFFWTMQIAGRAGGRPWKPAIIFRALNLDGSGQVFKESLLSEWENERSNIVIRNTLIWWARVGAVASKVVQLRKVMYPLKVKERGTEVPLSSCLVLAPPRHLLLETNEMSPNICSH